MHLVTAVLRFWEQTQYDRLLLCYTFESKEEAPCSVIPLRAQITRLVSTLTCFDIATTYDTIWIVNIMELTTIRSYLKIEDN